VNGIVEVEGDNMGTGDGKLWHALSYIHADLIADGL